MERNSKLGRKIGTRVASLALAGMVLFGTSGTVMASEAAAPEEVWWKAGGITHGTATEWINEDMLNTDIPADYQVNEATQGKAEDARYNAYFLKDKVQTVRIEVDETNLNYLLQNAIDEPYVLAKSVTIGDSTVEYCGLKTKGAYTLEHSYTENPGSDRFSFTVNFGKFIKKKDYGKKQDFYGANKISFNNFFFDKSMMKEFCALTIMEEMGLPTPQFGLAKLYINGNYYGVYAMVEAYDESILEQYYGVDDDDLSSYLVKPEGTTFLYEELLENDAPLWENDEDTYEDVADMLPTVMEWVRKLNCLSEGKDFEGNAIDVNSDEYIALLGQIYDLDEMLKYFAAHSWMSQLDSIFSGRKNFGLYIDEAGKALMVPWDYDLSFGCYFPCTAQLTANYDIDALYMLGTWGEDITGRTVKKDSYKPYPMFNVIFQNKELMERYHGYMKDCSKIAALGGTVESTGKFYEPGYINSLIEGLKEDLIAAASEKTAANVYYMNHIKQPTGVKNALSHLSKIIAMRAVGVVLQVDDVDSIVCAEGCDLQTLGNGAWGPVVVDGTISIVNEKTGMYATGQFQAGKRTAPTLTVTKLTTEAPMYAEILAATGAEEGDLFTVYNTVNRATAITDLDVTIPLTTEQLNHSGALKVYTYNEGQLKELEAKLTDNLCTVTTDKMEYIVIARTEKSGGTNGEDGKQSGNAGNGSSGDNATDASGSSVDDVTQGEQKTGEVPVAGVILGVTIVLMLGIATVVVLRKKS